MKDDNESGMFFIGRQDRLPAAHPHSKITPPSHHPAGPMRTQPPATLALRVAALFNKALVPTAGAALSSMFSVTPTRHPVSTLTPAPAVGTA